MLYLAVRHEGVEVGRKAIEDGFMMTMSTNAGSKQCETSYGTLRIPYDSHVAWLTEFLIGIVTPLNEDSVHFCPQFNRENGTIRVLDPIYDLGARKVREILRTAYRGKGFDLMFAPEFGGTRFQIEDWEFELVGDDDVVEEPQEAVKTEIIFGNWV